MGDKFPRFVGQSSTIIRSVPQKMVLTNLSKRATIRTSISYRSVPGKRGPEFVRSADL